MKYIILFSAFLSVNVLAGAGEDVFIRGKIGNSFNDKEVKIEDSLGQKYFLPRHVFPKHVKIKQGESFAFEVNEKHLTKVKILDK